MTRYAEPCSFDKIKNVGGPELFEGNIKCLVFHWRKILIAALYFYIRILRRHIIYCDEWCKKSLVLISNLRCEKNEQVETEKIIQYIVCMYVCMYVCMLSC